MYPLIRTVFCTLGEYANLWHMIEATRPTLEVTGWVERRFMKISDHDNMREVTKAEKTGAVLGLNDDL
jgi:hypothetical protein